MFVNGNRVKNPYEKISLSYKSKYLFDVAIIERCFLYVKAIQLVSSVFKEIRRISGSRTAILPLQDYSTDLSDSTILIFFK